MTDVVIADEQTNTQDVESTEAQEQNNVDVQKLLEENAKFKNEAEKWEGRYKSTQKKAKDENKGNSSVDIEAMFKQFEDKQSFIQEHGKEAISDEVKQLKEQHPSLSWEQAFKLSGQADDPAAKKDTSTGTINGTTNANLGTDVHKITQEELSKLPQVEYEVVSDKIDSGEIQLI